MTDWRELERVRVADLDARGIQVRRVFWCCGHSDGHDPTSKRGPVRVTAAMWKKHQQFVLRDRDKAA